MGRRHRKRIGEGIYSDEFGISATVKVGGRQREQRFAAGTSIEFIDAWRRRTREDLQDDAEAGEAPPPAGTYTVDLERYLTLIPNRVAFKADRSHLRAWLPHIGPLFRRQIRPSHVRKAIHAWQTAKKSARTIRHRVRVLREMWKRLDGPHAPTPALGVELPAPPAPHPVAVPWKTVERVAKSLKAGKRHEEGYGADCAQGRARFLVLAATGQRPAQVMRAKPEDLDLKRRIWFVRAAKGGVGIALPLDADMVKAWRLFIAASAWGTYDIRSFSHLLRRHGWPAKIRPYALRSTFAIDMILGGADMGDVQGALGHRQIETTRKHYASLQLARMRRALKLKKRARLA